MTTPAPQKRVTCCRASNVAKSTQEWMVARAHEGGFHQELAAMLERVPYSLLRSNKGLFATSDDVRAARKWSACDGRDENAGVGKGCDRGASCLQLPCADHSRCRARPVSRKPISVPRSSGSRCLARRFPRALDAAPVGHRRIGRGSTADLVRFPVPCAGCHRA